jgi:hypothetical protein
MARREVEGDSQGNLQTKEIRERERERESESEAGS